MKRNFSTLMQTTFTSIPSTDDKTNTDVYHYWWILGIVLFVVLLSLSFGFWKNFKRCTLIERIRTWGIARRQPVVQLTQLQLQSVPQFRARHQLVSDRPARLSSRRHFSLKHHFVRNQSTRHRSTDRQKKSRNFPRQRFGGQHQQSAATQLATSDRAVECMRIEEARGIGLPAHQFTQALNRLRHEQGFEIEEQRDSSVPTSSNIDQSISIKEYRKVVSVQQLTQTLNRLGRKQEFERQLQCDVSTSPQRRVEEYLRGQEAYHGGATPHESFPVLYRSLRDQGFAEENLEHQNLERSEGNLSLSSSPRELEGQTQRPQESQKHGLETVDCD